MRRAAACVLLCAGVVGLLPAPDPASGGPAAPLALATYESDHYRLETNVDPDVSAGYVRMLEAMWPQLEAFFGRAPALGEGEKLSVCFLATAEDWRTRMEDDGVRVAPGPGGYYSPAQRRAYLFRQPTIYNSRQLLLHEAMHQFHFLACTHNTAPQDTWYTEGLVEHLSRHYWDGETLQLGVVPFCSLADYPTQAAGLLGQDDYDLAALVASERASTRPEQWALVRFLLLGEGGRHAKAWARLAKRLDAGQPARSVFRKIVGKPERLLPALRTWLATQQEPFVPIWNEWIGLSAHGVEGTAPVTSACRTREPAAELSARLHVPDGAWKGGLLIGFQDMEAYTVFLLDDQGRYVVNRRVAGAWERLAGGAAPPPEERAYRLRAERGPGGVAVHVNDVLLGTFDRPGRSLGVCLDACTLRFTDITWR